GPADLPIARHGDLYLAHRDHRDDAFRDSVPLDALNTDSDELGASISQDQQMLYFDRRDASGRYQIFAVRSAAAGGYDTPVSLGLGDDTTSKLQPFVTSSA